MRQWPGIPYLSTPMANWAASSPPPGGSRRRSRLIAEEVAEVYPELVGYAATGEAQSVQYHKVNVLLLHEVQQQHRKIEEQTEELKALKAETAQLKASLETLGRMLGPVAQR